MYYILSLFRVIISNNMCIMFLITVLQPRLNEAKKSTEYVSQLNIKIREEITFINQGIGSLPSGK